MRDQRTSGRALVGVIYLVRDTGCSLDRCSGCFATGSDIQHQTHTAELASKRDSAPVISVTHDTDYCEGKDKIAGKDSIEDSEASKMDMRTVEWICDRRRTQLH
jgi:hypothetical protein